MEFKEYLMISGVQHFLFCKRQWALIHVENQWDENGLTTEGRIMHNRVHDGAERDVRNGIVTVRGLQVKSERYGIIGVCDAVELLPDEKGINFSKLKGTWRIRPVEYKRGHSKIDNCDRVQVAAQALCLEEMLACEIEEGAIFYGKIRRRETVKITNELREETKNAFLEMWNYYERGYTPQVRSTVKCKSCSLRDICLPELLRGGGKKSVEKYIAEHMVEEE